jgi:hypothetical protein
MKTLLRRLVGPGTPLRAVLAIVFERVIVPLAGGAPPGLRRGRGVAVLDAPVVLVVVRGGGEPGVNQVLTTVRQAQLAHGGFTPVFVLDEPAWSPLRRAGYAVEHLPTGTLDTAERLAELRQIYATDSILVVPGERPEVLTIALVLGAATARRRPDLVTRLRQLPRRLERWFDPGGR